jgi:hypothetical protein
LNYDDSIIFSKYIDKVNLLNLTPDELDMDKFGRLIFDDLYLISYFNFLKLFKTDEFINSKMDDLNNTSFSIKIINNVCNKIGLLRHLEKLYFSVPHKNFLFIKKFYKRSIRIFV